MAKQLTEKEKNREKVLSNKALQTVSERLEMTPGELYDTIKSTVAPALSTRPEFLAFMSIAQSYKLNPIRNEITAFKTQGGGIKTIVPIDGWISIVNKQKNFDGVELVENWAEKENKSGTKLDSVTAKFYLNDKNHPIVVTEYMEECYKGGSSYSPWKKWPRRMLRHKAYIQGARIAFGLSGIYDEDEAERIQEVDEAVDTSEIKEPQPKQPEPGTKDFYDQEIPESKLKKHIKEPKEAEVVDEEPDEGQDEAQEAQENASGGEIQGQINEEEPEATSDTPKKKNPSKKSNMSDQDKVDATYFVQNAISKTPGEVSEKELKESFKLMKGVLGEETYQACLQVWNKKSASEIEKASVAKVVLQIMLSKVKAGGIDE